MKHESWNLSRSEISDMIDEWIFNEQHRMILKRRLLDGLTYEELAGEFHISTQTAKRIVYISQDKLFKHIPLT